ncbi:hypothetical protein BKA62DRAFT_626581 [Auriculariales sp. MPI-PUGE-AT-0066]|nr:hypothetical protein BKA62DRAFT_626581 [Auriculariales sp. MPI-PUGE-AT-0066]
MINNRGPDSYIWGRSVDNIRIERLWVDVVRGVVNKWHVFFQQLERFDGLDVEVPTHLWLLHHLFLQHINDDLHEWANMWNRHPMSIDHNNRDISDRTSESPLSMYTYGMIRNGARGFSVQAQDVQPEVVPQDAQPEVVPHEELQDYGVDWPAQERVRRSRRMHNPEQSYDEPHVEPGRPTRFSEVNVVPPNAPDIPNFIHELDQRLEHSLGHRSASLEGRRLLWMNALRYLHEVTVSV